MKLDLDKVKVIFFDFDNTLCLHEYKPYTNDLYDLMILNNDIEYKGIKSELMQTFINKCSSKDMHLISSIAFNSTAEHKIRWVKDNYGVAMKNACVGSVDAKVKYVLAYAKANGINNDEILVIDDLVVDVIEVCWKDNIQACTPQLMQEYVYNNLI